MFFWRSAAVKTVKGVENTSFNKKLGETTFPYPVPLSEKFLQNTQLVKGSWPRLLKAFQSQMQQEKNSSNNKKKQGKGVADYQLTFHCTRFNNHRASFRFHVFPTLQNAPLLFAETGLLFGKCTCLLSAKRGRWIVSKTIQFWKSNVQQWRVIGFQRNLLMVYI